MVRRAAWARILPFATYLFFIFLADMLGRLGWAAHELRWLYGFKIGAVLLVLVYFWRDYGELARFDLSARGAALAVAVGLVVLVLWVNLSAGWMVLGTPAGFDPRTNGVLDWTLAAPRILGAALVVPVMEELFWRSFLMRWIESPAFLQVDPAQIKLKSFIVTVILFGVEHELWLAGMVAGSAYGVLYMRSRSLYSAILAHGVTNGVLAAWIISTGKWTYW